MSSWFSRSTTLDPSDPAAQLGAYKEGRRDERRQVETAVPDRRVVQHERDDAYDRGRRDARSRHRASPVGALLFLILAVLIVGAIALRVHYGSFTAAGAAADTALASTTNQAVAPVHNAADKAGNALENAGQNLKQTAGSGSQ